MALGSTQPLTEMSTRNISGGGGRQPVRRGDNLTTFMHCHYTWQPQPSGALRVCPGLLYLQWARIVTCYGLDSLGIDSQ